MKRPIPMPTSKQGRKKPCGRKRIDRPSTGPAPRSIPVQVHEDACHHDTAHPRTTQADLQSAKRFRTLHQALPSLAAVASGEYPIADLA